MRRLLCCLVLLTTGAAPDLYEVLGVARNATDRDLRTAYRRLALEHHPDQGGCEETMARLNHARDVLCDPAARRNHDRELDGL
mgnify:CR=1 FL=1